MSRSLLVNLTLLAVALLAAGGCGGGPSQPAVNTITGTVSFNDKIINYGSVAFYNESGRLGKSVIQSDGRYDLRTAALGEVKVVVDTEVVPTPMNSPGGGGGGAPPKFVKIDIPEDYSDPAKTDLRYTVTPGQSHFDINLKSEPKP